MSVHYNIPMLHVPLRNDSTADKIIWYTKKVSQYNSKMFLNYQFYLSFYNSSIYTNLKVEKFGIISLPGFGVVLVFGVVILGISDVAGGVFGYGVVLWVCGVACGMLLSFHMP